MRVIHHIMQWLWPHKDVHNDQGAPSVQWLVAMWRCFTSWKKTTQCITQSCNCITVAEGASVNCLAIPIWGFENGLLLVKYLWYICLSKKFTLLLCWVSFKFSEMGWGGGVPDYLSQLFSVRPVISDIQFVQSINFVKIYLFHFSVRII